MNPKQIIEALKTVISIKQPAFLWGSPGIGKSQIVKQVANEMKLKVEDIRAVLLDPVDLRGLPYLKDGKASWAIPEFLPTEGEGVLFLDELNAAPPLVQAACYQLVLDRKLGNYEVPEGWAVIGAGNNESDKAIVHRMSTALSNRFTHIEFDIDLNDWVSWALNNKIMIEIVGFLRFRPELLHDFDPKKNEKAFPSPRAWEFVSKILSANPSKEIEYELLKGTIGEGAAGELIAFLQIFRTLPNPDTILLNPQSGNVPSDPATLYALCGALAKKATEQTFNRIMEYGSRLPREFTVLLVRDSIENDKQICNTRAFIEWTTENSDIYL